MWDYEDEMEERLNPCEGCEDYFYDEETGQDECRSKGGCALLDVMAEVAYGVHKF